MLGDVGLSRYAFCSSVRVLGLKVWGCHFFSRVEVQDLIQVWGLTKAGSQHTPVVIEGS